MNLLIKRAASNGNSIEIDIEEAVHDFSDYVKPDYTGTEDSLSLKVGGRRLNHPEMRISTGRMKLPR